MKFSRSVFQLFLNLSPIKILGVTPLEPTLFELFLRKKTGWEDIQLEQQDVDVSRAELKNATLNGSDLQNVDLSGEDLSGANLSGANLSGANLSGANLSGANLSGADLSRADLQDADLSRADLSGADLQDANLKGANLKETVCPSCVIFVCIDKEIAEEPQGLSISLYIDDPNGLIDVTEYN